AGFRRGRLYDASRPARTSSAERFFRQLNPSDESIQPLRSPPVSLASKMTTSVRFRGSIPPTARFPFANPIHSAGETRGQPVLRSKSATARRESVHYLLDESLR